MGSEIEFPPNVETFPSVHTIVCVSIPIVFSGFALFRCSEARSVVLDSDGGPQVSTGSSFCLQYGSSADFRLRFALFRFVDRVFVVFS